LDKVAEWRVLDALAHVVDGAGQLALKLRPRRRPGRAAARVDVNVLEDRVNPASAGVRPPRRDSPVGGVRRVGRPTESTGRSRRRAAEGRAADDAAADPRQRPDRVVLDGGTRGRCGSGHVCHQFLSVLLPSFSSLLVDASSVISGPLPGPDRAGRNARRIEDIYAAADGVLDGSTHGVAAGNLTVHQRGWRC
jgi:hypothetical protein